MYAATRLIALVIAVVFALGSSSSVLAQMMPPQGMPPNGYPMQQGYPGCCVPPGDQFSGAGDGGCAAMMGYGDPACCGDYGPRWTFTADILALQRSTTRSQTLFENAFSEDDLNSKHLDFPAAVGFQVSAIRHNCCFGWDLEVGYFQIDGWTATDSVPGESYMTTDVNPASLWVSNSQVRYMSDFHIGEINVRRQCRDWLTLLAGFRMGEYNERYHAFGTDVISGESVIGLNANTYNHLYGFQIGADAEVYNMGGPLRINALCKAGIYANSASQNIRQSISDGTLDQLLGAERKHTAFMGEAGLVATYQVTCHLAFRASYQAVWLEGVALAPEQIGATDFTFGSTAVDTAGGVFYHGGGLGVELKF